MKTCMMYGCDNKTEKNVCDKCYKTIMETRKKTFDQIQDYLKKRGAK